MDDAQIGWIAAIIIGGVAGWLAEQFMKSDMGILMNVVRYHRGSRCQRHFELLWNPPRRMDRLPDCRVHRRSLADLDRTGGPRDTPASIKTNQSITLLVCEAASVGGLFHFKSSGRCPLLPQSGHSTCACPK